MNKSVVAIVSLLLPVMFSSCNVLMKKPSRKNVTIDSTTVSTSPIGPQPMPEPEAVVVPPSAAAPSMLSPEKQALIATLLPLWNSRMDYTTFKGKAKMHYEGSGMKQDFTANIRMAKDSVIWVHITAGMGLVNVARIMVTPDSFILVNYLEKSVKKMPVSEVKKVLPASVDFGVLQNLITGEALSQVGQPTDATDFGGTWSLNITDPDVSQQINYNKADSTMRTLQVLSQLGGGFTGMIQYGNYSIIDNKKFAISRAINIQNKEDQHYLDMTFNNATFNEVLDFPFSIPESYTLNK